MSTAMQNLPPEMQERLAQVMAQAQAQGGIPVVTGQQAPVQQQQPQPPAKQPSLIEHVVALRQEVAALRQELNAVGQVVQATGQATGEIYHSLFNTGGADYSAQAGAGGEDF